MKKYILLYKGNGSAPSGSQEEIMKQWMDWFSELGEAVVGGGNPFATEAKAVSANGVENFDANLAVSGYSIVNAENIEAAIEMAKGCPIHKQDGGVASVEVYEALPM